LYLEKQRPKTYGLAMFNMNRISNVRFLKMDKNLAYAHYFSHTESCMEQVQLPDKIISCQGDLMKTQSGLEYIEVVAGTGAQAEAGKIVSVHYTGKFQDGKVFDSSVTRGEPITFPLGSGNVIKGWDEGIALMRVGGKAQLIIPPNLAYGARGAGGVIPPNATLVFDVELVLIK
jgi:FKBP-type peptidyl-prolyl cis-trans isomerase